MRATVDKNALRAGETAIEAPPPNDAGLVFIGRIHTPWQDRLTCPRQGKQDGPICRIAAYQHIEVLYWLHLSRRDIVRQSPRNDGVARGAFSLRTPVRPNPIGTQLVALVGVEGANLFVRGLDCLDGTPLIDLKPDRCAYTPLVPAKGNDPAGAV
jgi:tRNA (adenine37-N6)-methyltransferase